MILIIIVDTLVSISKKRDKQTEILVKVLQTIETKR